jgi:hypothetical protein
MPKNTKGICLVFSHLPSKKLASLLHTTENIDADLFNNLAQHFERPLSKAKMDGIMHATEHGCPQTKKVNDPQRG